MDLYLMQPGEAAAEADDPTSRPLTGAGWAAVARVAARAEAAGVRVDRCVHSSKLRGADSASAAAAAAGGRVEAAEGLAPNDPIRCFGH